jgi:tetratricopeptide (TPR) repeat protein
MRMGRLVAPALGSAIVLACARAAAGGGRDPGDEEELAVMRAKVPRAAELFAQGEALVAKGALAEADARFKEGIAAYAEGSLLWRRDCEVKTALGQRSEAILACSEALERRHDDVVDRALASAFLDGPAPTTDGNLYQAWLVVERARKNPLGRVTAAATTCDLAETIGDGIMLQECQGLLARIAPNDPATERASAALRAFGPRPSFWMGWGTVLAAVVVTLVDAVRRLRLRTRPGTAAALLFLSLLGASATARAEDRPASAKGLSKWPVSLEHPEDGIPSEAERDADPLQFGYWIQDVAATAERKSKEGDHRTAAMLYAALGKAVPDRAVSFVKMCEEYEAIGELAQAADACGQALLRDGVHVVDYTRFVHLMLGKPGELREKDLSALAAVLGHMKEDPAGREAATDLECQIGAKTSNVLQLRECTAVLAAQAPDDPKTVTYLWALAVAEGRFDDARKLGAQARAAGVSDDAVVAMGRATASNQARHRWSVVALFAAVIFVAGIAFVSRKLLRRAPGDARVSMGFSTRNL